MAWVGTCMYVRLQMDLDVKQRPGHVWCYRRCKPPWPGITEVFGGRSRVQVQAENVQQAEALVRVANKLERVEGDLRDTQGLLGALHGAHPLFFKPK